MGKEVAVTLEDGTVLKIGAGSIETKSGLNVVIKDDTIHVSRGLLCKDCGHQMIYETNIIPGQDIVVRTYCPKCHPDKAEIFAVGG
jgi:hypothetical protein